jgi:putative endonuclease
MADNTARSIGQMGEQIAARFLESRGCRVLMANVYGDGGEIDLVVSDGGTVAAVEVKTSTRRHVIERVDDRKWDLVQRTGAAARYPIRRFDVVSVLVASRFADIRWLRGVD